MRRMIHIEMNPSLYLCSSLCGRILDKQYNDVKDSAVFVPIACRNLTFSMAVYDVCEECFNHPSFVLLDLAESDL